MRECLNEWKSEWGNVWMSEWVFYINHTSKAIFSIKGDSLSYKRTNITFFFKRNQYRINIEFFFKAQNGSNRTNWLQKALKRYLPSQFKIFQLGLHPDKLMTIKNMTIKSVQSKNIIIYSLNNLNKGHKRLWF